MKASTASTDKNSKKESKKEEKRAGRIQETLNRHPKLRFLLQTAGFYILMMTLYLYYMMANLSTAPKFVYTQF